MQCIFLAQTFLERGWWRSFCLAGVNRVIFNTPESSTTGNSSGTVFVHCHSGRDKIEKPALHAPTWSRFNLPSPFDSANSSKARYPLFRYQSGPRFLHDPNETEMNHWEIFPNWPWENARQPFLGAIVLGENKFCSCVIECRCLVEER